MMAYTGTPALVDGTTGATAERLVIYFVELLIVV